MPQTLGPNGPFAHAHAPNSTRKYQLSAGLGPWATGTTIVALARVATRGGARTPAADSPRDGAARHSTRASKSMSLERVPTRVTVAVTSTTSPAWIGARNSTAE